MDKKEIKKRLKELLKDKRYVHSLGVASVSRHLAETYGYADPDKAELAGLVHDCAKNLPLVEMQQLTDEGRIPMDLALYNSKALLHGPAGSVLARKLFGITDEEILSAVYYHTTGHPDMQLLEKIVFLADYIEPSRDFPGVDKLRRLSEISLDKAVLAAYASTISHLLDTNAFIYPLTMEGRNDLLKKMEEGQ